MAAQREWFDKDYYKVLGLSKSATDKEITKAYRKLAKQYHPDANPGDAKAEDRFKDISAAYDVLGDVAKRKEYDEVRQMAAAGGGFGVPGGGARGGNPFGASAGGTSGGTFNFQDLGDIFGGLFGRGGSAAGSRERGTGPQRGEDLETQLHLSFLDAVNGVTTSVNITSDAACESCGGSGAEPGTMPVSCPKCAGRGVMDDNQGVFSFSRPCPECSGTGRKVEHFCKACKGNGTQRKNRQVKVRIPAGVDEGQRIRLKGRGGAGANGGPPGDLYVKVHVAKHSMFGRKGKDLTLVVPVTFAELALGATVKVPTLTSPVTLKIAAGTRSGTVMRVRGRGVASEKSPGDLLVTIEVTIPQKLSSKERAAIEALTEVTNSESVRSHLKVE